MEKDKMMPYRVVLVGGSAGSLEVVLELLKYMLPFRTYSLVIVLHRKSGEDNKLEQLLAMKTKIPVKEVEDKTALVPGAIYVAPSDYHLLFEKDGTLSLDTSDKVNYSRPSIDVSLESAADAYGSRVAAILLSGANADGTDGLKAVKQAGGTTVVQDPKTAEMPFMPNHAIENAEPGSVLNVEEIGEFLNDIASLAQE